MMTQRRSIVLNNTLNGDVNPNHIIPFSGIDIETTVTNRASVIADWIRQVYTKYSGTRIVVALVCDRCEILQLCSDKYCLIFQLHHMDKFPQALQNFFDDSDVMFVGIDGYCFSHLSFLKPQFGLDCSTCIQLIDLPTSSYASNIISKLGRYPQLLALAKHIEGLNIEKPNFVANSNWKAERLSVEQIRYASIDAYATHKIARKLLSTNN